MEVTIVGAMTWDQPEFVSKCHMSVTGCNNGIQTSENSVFTGRAGVVDFDEAKGLELLYQ